MNSLPVVSTIRHKLADWYLENKRDLPWRQTTDPYSIWLSEIILQQTRIDQGLSYYEHFLSRYPDIFSLAAATQKDVLKSWQGLGYYSRARNLHETAMYIANQLNGQFPDSYEGLLKLKGIGSYTAAAIASFSFGLPHAVLDGNVFRVISRLFMIDTPIYSTEGKKEFTKLATDLLNPDDPAQHNQAIMEFGALQCLPGKPNCHPCPLKGICMAFKQDVTNLLPVRKTELIKKHRYFNYIVCMNGSTTWMKPRTQKDIWQELYEFPMIESDTALTIEQLIENETIINWIGQNAFISTPVTLKHTLSHQVIHATFLRVKVNFSNMEAFSTINLKEKDQPPVPKPIELYLSNYLTI